MAEANPGPARKTQIKMKINFFVGIFFIRIFSGFVVFTTAQVQELFKRKEI
ncbi:MAG: hypothetical protein OEZ59_02305 [Deltaproteobacteria bacterium]|nr:hypothetical protein [Deltaproteobacteria bacterium]